MLSNRPYLEIAKDELNFREQIGRGAQGAVYKALWKTKQQVVAVKHVLEFDPEIVVLQRIQHKHIVQFLGAVEEEHFKAIVLEYAEHGSLYRIIQEETPDFEQLLIWSRHIALGLNYLHNGVEPRIIHRDLKSRNVVIAASNRIAKICDFGSSRELRNTYTRFSRLHGTVGWMAPEVMRQSEVSVKCDTYSFAMLLWELITGKIPFHGEEDPQIMFGVCQHKRRPPIPHTCPHAFADLIRSCWQDAPDKRPIMEEILQTLHGMLFNVKLTDEVDHFLATRQEWVAEFDRTIEEIRIEFQQIESAWEKRLNEKDNEIQQMKNRSRYLSSMAPEEKGVSGWKEIEVVSWLNYNLPDLGYVSNEFLSNNITGLRLLNLTDEDIQTMGITSYGHRKDILAAISGLKKKMEGLEHYPPLMSNTPKPEKTPTKNPGTLFTLCLTYGNTFIPGKKPKWNLFLYVEGDSIATSSIKCVEFRIASNDVVKRNRIPFVMENFRYDKPKGEVECKLVFRGNIIKPKTLSKKFEVQLGIGGYSSTCEIEIYLNEEHVPSTAASLASSISLASYSSFNVMDNWETSAAPVMGAWVAGPPSFARSPGFAPHPIRRDSSPFSSSPFSGSPNISPTQRRKYSSGNGDHKLKLNKQSSSPGKAYQMVRSRDLAKSRDWTPLSFPEVSKGLQKSDLTPTHDPRNPRFTSARSSMVSQFNLLDLEAAPRFTFGSLVSTDLNMHFNSAQSTIVDNTPQLAASAEMFTFNPSVGGDQESEKTAKRRGRSRGISVSSTLSANSTSSMKELVARVDECTDERTLKRGVVPPPSEWWDTPTWGVPSDAPPHQDHNLPSQEEEPLHNLPPQEDKTSALISNSPRTQPAYNMPPPPDCLSSLARAGKVTYADILKCPSAEPAPGVTPPEPQPNTLPPPRNRKNSTGSNASDKQRGGYKSKRGNRSQRGRGGKRGSGKSFSGSPKYK